MKSVPNFSRHLVIVLCLFVYLANSVSARTDNYLSDIFKQTFPTFVFQQDKARTLTAGETLEPELSGGASHSYKIKASANQYLKIIIEQKGIDIVAELYFPDGKKLLEVDSPNGTQGPEPIETITPVDGDYFLKVRSLENNAPAGRYEIKVLELRTSTEKDKHSIAAQKAIQEANELKAKRTAQTYKNAITKYEEAITHLKATGDKAQEANILSNISHIYDLFGDNAKYIEYTIQALNLRKEIKDRIGEAESLNNLAVGYSHIGDKEKALEIFNQALQLNRELKLRKKEASTLNNIGDLYKDNGDTKKAIEFLNQALPLWRLENDKSGEAKTLGEHGNHLSAGKRFFQCP